MHVNVSRIRMFYKSVYFTYPYILHIRNSDMLQFPIRRILNIIVIIVGNGIVDLSLNF